MAIGLLAEVAPAEKQVTAESQIPFAFNIEDRVFSELLNAVPATTVVINAKGVQERLARRVQHLMPDDWTGDAAAVAAEIYQAEIGPKLKPQLPAFNAAINRRLDERLCAGATLMASLAQQMARLKPAVRAWIDYRYEYPPAAFEEGSWHRRIGGVCGDSSVLRSYQAHIDGRFTCDLKPFGHDRSFPFSVPCSAEVSCRISFSWKKLSQEASGSSIVIRFRPVATVTAMRNLGCHEEVYSASGEVRVRKQHIIEHPVVHEIVLQAEPPENTDSQVGD